MKPILFNTEMVRAILDGRKTVTRRICKDANDYTVPMGDFIDNDKRTYAVQSFYDKNHEDPCSLAEVNMPICIGDILWVRETWGKGYEEGSYIYKASDKLASLPSFKESSRLIYHPSIHMPKEAARIFLKVTDVRVERLQDITEDGAESEGVCGLCYDAKTGAKKYDMTFFHILWDSTIKKTDINKYGWLANPYVFVIEFERCERPEGWEE
jgi:hypothetical protein